MKTTNKTSIKITGYLLILFIGLSLVSGIFSHNSQLLRAICILSVLSSSILLIIGVILLDGRNKKALRDKHEKEVRQRREIFASLSKEQRQFELENYMHDLRKAQSAAAWSYLGLIMPLIGWILAGISSSSLKSIPGGISDSLDNRVRRIRSNINISVLLSILVVMFYIFASAFHNNTIQNTANPTTSATTNNLQNLEAQNSCISEAQAEVNNNPMYQPVGGNSESYALSQQEKALAMQPKIDDCKIRYPTSN